MMGDVLAFRPKPGPKLVEDLTRLAVRCGCGCIEWLILATGDLECRDCGDYASLPGKGPAKVWFAEEPPIRPAG